MDILSCSILFGVWFGSLRTKFQQIISSQLSCSQKTHRNESKRVRTDPFFPHMLSPELIDREQAGGARGHYNDSAWILQTVTTPRLASINNLRLVINQHNLLFCVKITAKLLPNFGVLERLSNRSPNTAASSCLTTKSLSFLFYNVKQAGKVTQGADWSNQCNVMKDSAPTVASLRFYIERLFSLALGKT